MAGAPTAKARSAHAASVDHLGTHSARYSAESSNNDRLGNSRSDSRNRRDARVLPGSRRPALACRGSVQRTVKKAGAHKSLLCAHATSQTIPNVTLCQSGRRALITAPLDTCAAHIDLLERAWRAPVKPRVACHCRPAAKTIMLLRLGGA